jgi:hypothetical protein
VNCEVNRIGATGAGILLLAQMHFVSELPLSEGDHSIKMDGQMVIIQANPRLTRKNGETPRTNNPLNLNCYNAIIL